MYSATSLRPPPRYLVLLRSNHQKILNVEAIMMNEEQTEIILKIYTPLISSLLCYKKKITAV